jgi:hypothetical protein
MTWKSICETCGSAQPCERCVGEVSVERTEILEYEKDDYLLINRVGQVVAVSGNEDFGQPQPPSGPYAVVKVVSEIEYA